MKSAKQILKMPALLALGTLVGLISALVSDGFGDVLAWLLLAIPALWPVPGIWRAWRSRGSPR